MRDYLRDLNPRLPREVLTLQAGGLVNAFGNGLMLPFLFIYLHNVRGIDLGLSGLIVGTNGLVGLVSGPAIGSVIDRVGGRRTLTGCLGLMAVGYACYPLVHEPWQGFGCALVAGIGNGGFWPSQSSLLAGLAGPEARHAAFATQRVMMNLGIGLGGLAGGLIAVGSEPRSFVVLFLVDAATFVAYMGALRLVPQPALEPRAPDERRGSYRDVLRNRPFVAVLAVNVLFVTAGMAQLETYPVYAKNEAGLSETLIGVAFFVNTLAIVLLQLPITRALEGRRRMPAMTLTGVVWGASWLLMPLAGAFLGGAAALALLVFAIALFGVGECLQGTVQAPLVADLAEPRLLGRYMALSAWTWGVGFTAGPAIGGFVLKASPHALWLGAAGILLAAGLASLALERALPEGVRRTPRRALRIPAAAEPAVGAAMRPE